MSKMKIGASIMMGGAFLTQFFLYYHLTIYLCIIILFGAILGLIGVFEEDKKEALEEQKEEEMHLCNY